MIILNIKFIFFYYFKQILCWSLSAKINDITWNAVNFNPDIKKYLCNINSTFKNKKGTMIWIVNLTNITLNTNGSEYIDYSIFYAYVFTCLWLIYRSHYVLTPICKNSKAVSRLKCKKLKIYNFSAFNGWIWKFNWYYDFKSKVFWVDLNL